MHKMPSEEEDDEELKRKWDEFITLFFLWVDGQLLPDPDTLRPRMFEAFSLWFMHKDSSECQEETFIIVFTY